MLSPVKGRLEEGLRLAMEAGETAAARLRASLPHLPFVRQEDAERPREWYLRRRHSVFSESWDPETLDNSDYCKVIHPKSSEQRDQLQLILNDIFLLRNLEEEEQAEIMDAVEEKLVQDGEEVIRKGADGDYFYIIAQGTFLAKAGTDEMSEETLYEGTGSFGELALLYNTPRTASVMAISPGRLWALDGLTFQRIVKRSAYRKRLAYDTFLSSVPLLQSLTPYERLSLADALIPRRLPSATTVLTQTGSLRISVTHPESGEDIEISQLSAKDYFGELALVARKPRSATVTTLTPCKLAFLEVGALERLLGPCLDVLKRNEAIYEAQLERLLADPTAPTAPSPSACPSPPPI